MELAVINMIFGKTYKLKNFICMAITASTLLYGNGSAYAQDKSLGEPPPHLFVLQDVPDSKSFGDVEAQEEEVGGMFDIRFNALKEAGLSYGARGGLAYRTYQIRKHLESRSDYMDKVFNFGRLLIPAPSGLLIEPPVVSEAENGLVIGENGQEAAVSDIVYQINKGSRIVAAPRHWREYLERTWGDVEPPPDILRPSNDEEREVWEDAVEKGWKEGVRQADEIFQRDLGELVADFEGMVRYHKLVALGMISKPFALQEDRGITGGGDEMRIGNRAIRITGRPELIPGYEQWLPANR